MRVSKLDDYIDAFEQRAACNVSNVTFHDTSMQYAVFAVCLSSKVSDSRGRAACMSTVSGNAVVSTGLLAEATSSATSLFELT